jgi:hypothetical protein
MNIQTVKKNVIDGEVVSYQVTQQNSNLILSVPLSSDNAGYQAILEWVAEGNTIEEAD